MTRNRLSRQDPSFILPSAEAALAQNPYMTPEDLTQLLVLEDSDLSLYAVLVEHLQSRPYSNSAPPIEARHGYLPSTTRRAKAAKLNGGTVNESYDPDFTLREANVPGLAGEDETYQKPLLKTLWDLVRHGELDQAIRVAEEGGEPWRGASLMGGRRWTMGGLSESLRWSKVASLWT
jgi:nuclear pore complex protein Nup107